MRTAKQVGAALRVAGAAAVLAAAWTVVAQAALEASEAVPWALLIQLAV